MDGDRSGDTGVPRLFRFPSAGDLAPATGLAQLGNGEWAGLYGELTRGDPIGLPRGLPPNGGVEHGNLIPESFFVLFFLELFSFVDFVGVLPGGVVLSTEELRERRLGLDFTSRFTVHQLLLPWFVFSVFTNLSWRDKLCRIEFYKNNTRMHNTQRHTYSIYIQNKPNAKITQHHHKLLN